MSASAQSAAPQQRVADRVGHRREELLLDALEREERQVRRDDDHRREEHRARDLRSRPRARRASVSASSGFSSRFRRMFSSTTIAPSTMMPKSIAPSDSRFAGMSVTAIRMNAMSSDERDRDRDDERAPRAAEEER